MALCAAKCCASAGRSPSKSCLPRQMRRRLVRSSPIVDTSRKRQFRPGATNRLAGKGLVDDECRRRPFPNSAAVEHVRADASSFLEVTRASPCYRRMLRAACRSGWAHRPTHAATRAPCVWRLATGVLAVTVRAGLRITSRAFTLSHPRRGRGPSGRPVSRSGRRDRAWPANRRRSPHPTRVGLCRLRSLDSAAWT